MKDRKKVKPGHLARGCKSACCFVCALLTPKVFTVFTQTASDALGVCVRGAIVLAFTGPNSRAHITESS